MSYKDPEKQKAAQRASAKRRRERASPPKKKLELKGVNINTVDDLKNIVSASLFELVDTPMEPGQRGRCIAQLVGCAIKLLEVGDLTARIEALEARR